MPALIVYGISDEMRDKLEDFCDSLISTVASVDELDLKRSDVSCFFPGDLLKRSGEEIIIFVEGLLERPARTQIVRDKLANRIVETSCDYFPDANLVECFVHSFDPEKGISSFAK